MTLRYPGSSLGLSNTRGGSNKLVEVTSIPYPVSLRRSKLEVYRRRVVSRTGHRRVRFRLSPHIRPRNKPVPSNNRGDMMTLLCPGSSLEPSNTRGGIPRLVEVMNIPCPASLRRSKLEVNRHRVVSRTGHRRVILRLRFHLSSRIHPRNRVATNSNRRKVSLTP